MRTVIDNLSALCEELALLLQQLILDHSRLYQAIDPAGLILRISGDHSWAELSEDGRQLQSRLLEEYRRFASLVEALLSEQPADTVKEFSDARATVLHLIEQDAATWNPDKNHHINAGLDALRKHTSLLNRLYGIDAGATLVPDTNALLYNPNLEQWRFATIPRFLVVLTPGVVSELDEMKVVHRNDAVRDRAERLIRQIKEYRRRGNGRLLDPVPLASNVSSIVAIATEPRTSEILPWLDPSNNDDRILAATIEVMRRRPRSAVGLVTRDLNLQNKAEYARVPFVEPPDP